LKLTLQLLQIYKKCGDGARDQHNDPDTIPIYLDARQLKKCQRFAQSRDTEVLGEQAAEGNEHPGRTCRIGSSAMVHAGL
jgi:hypothetical protein